MKLISILLALTFSVSAFADDRINRCLKRATDNQLLDEVYSRMGGSDRPSPIPDEAYEVYCDNNYYLYVKTTNLTTGEEQTRVKQYLSTQCSTAETLYKEQLMDRTLTQNTMIAYCDNNYYMYKMLLKTSGEIQEVSKTYLSTGCQAAADDINNRNDRR